MAGEERVAVVGESTVHDLLIRLRAGRPHPLQGLGERDHRESFVKERLSREFKQPRIEQDLGNVVTVTQAAQVGHDVGHVKRG